MLISRRGLQSKMWETQSIRWHFREQYQGPEHPEHFLLAGSPHDLHLAITTSKLSGTDSSGVEG